MSLVEIKRRMRAQALETRKSAAHASVTAGNLAAEQFFGGFGAYLDAAPHPVVSAYWPMGDEFDVRPMMDKLSRQDVPCALPVVAGKDLPLIFRRWRAGDDLVSGPFGTSTPSSNAPEMIPTLLLMPLLAFDQAGGRLGYGGGFYDRSLAGLRRTGSPQAVGVAFDVQEMDAVPMGDTDQRLDWVVTESRIIQCAG
jgi:5-formyltetrahydrofolate cyclo-ligase